jgi:hypothetical protein
MKYLEELSPGDTFLYNNKRYLLTSDFKNNGQRMCCSLEDGFPTWIEANSITEDFAIYYLDPENNISPIKNTK